MLKKGVRTALWLTAAVPGVWLSGVFFDGDEKERLFSLLSGDLKPSEEGKGANTDRTGPLNG